MEITSEVYDLQVEEQRLVSKIESFFVQLRVGTLANRCGITKTKGVATTDLLLCIFSLPFLRLNIYRQFASKRVSNFGKDAVYDFMRSYRFSWRRFLLLLSALVCQEFQSLTSDKRETVLIIDDSTIHRPRSKKVELLARVFDHTQSKFLKGFRMLTLCWSDGASLAPLDFALLSSTKEKNRYQGVTKHIDSRSCGARRRNEATTKATALIGPMLKRALAAGVKARYLLMDSWFGMPSIIAEAATHLPVICMIKRTPKLLYTYKNERLTVDAIYRKLKKRRGRAKILASAEVTINNGDSARIVFVRNKHKKDWLALLSTDTNLGEADVVRIYGKRWDIEVFFRTVKQHLDLEKGCQARDFDALIAHTTIVMARYLFLAREQRRHDDPRTLGILFHACCDEIHDLEYMEALQRIFTSILYSFQENKDVGEKLSQLVMTELLNRTLHKYRFERDKCQRSKAIAA